MRSIKKSICAGSCLILASLQSAPAATYLYSYSGTDGSFSFLDSSTPTPTQFVPGAFFNLTENGTFDGIKETFDIGFRATSLGGGFSAGSGPFLLEFGPQLYSGTESNPAFAVQDTHVNFFGAASGNFKVSAVPEPSTWAMMLLGFGGLGFLAYRKTRKGDAMPMAA